MAARPANITQAEVERMLKGALEVGFPIGRVDVDFRRGVMSLYPERSSAASPEKPREAEGRNSCDDAFGL